MAHRYGAARRIAEVRPPLVDELAAAWGAPVRIICSKNGPACCCGSFTYRSRVVQAGARTAVPLLETRCEDCRRVSAIDPADPGRVIVELGARLAAAEQETLF